MAMRFAVELTAGAVRDLEGICDGLAERRGADDAAALLDAFIATIETLESFPNRGGIPKELGAVGIADFRQLHMDHFRLIYRVAGQTVYIVLIADGRRDMQSLLQQRLLSQ